MKDRTVENEVSSERIDVGDEARSELRESLRTFFGSHAQESSTLRTMETPQGYDETIARRLSGEFALQGLAIPEEFGGLGFGWQELAVAFTELGRVVYPGPFLSRVMAAQTLLELGDPDKIGDHLSAIAAGSRYGVAIQGIPLQLPRKIAADARSNAEVSIKGSTDWILDGADVDNIVVAAAGEGCYLLTVVPVNDETVKVTPIPTMDLTRRFAHIEFVASTGPLLNRDELHRHGFDVLKRMILLAIACENLGGSEAVLQTTVAYAKTRVQFGRTIGSFQAVKHRCADMLISLEMARATCTDAILAVVDKSDDASLRTHLAAAIGIESYVAMARSMIQVHGGLAITWEHIAHLHLKRAKSSSVLFGSPASHHRTIALELGLPFPNESSFARRD